MLKKAEKSNFTFQSDVVPEIDHEAAVVSSRSVHRAEFPMVNRGPAAGSFSRPEKQDTTERQKPSLQPRSHFKNVVDADELLGPSKVYLLPLNLISIRVAFCRHQVLISMHVLFYHHQVLILSA